MDEKPLAPPSAKLPYYRPDLRCIANGVWDGLTICAGCSQVVRIDHTCREQDEGGK